MANALYDKGRNGFLQGQIAWVSADIRVLLVDTDEYTVNVGTHEFLTSIPGAARVATAPLANKTAVDGVADADDVTFTGVSGAESEALVIYLHTGTDGTSRLIAYIDSATGLPVLPNTGDIVVTWDNGPNKIFKI
jgi:hypothetical protein